MEILNFQLYIMWQFKSSICLKIILKERQPSEGWRTQEHTNDHCGVTDRHSHTGMWVAHIGNVH